MKSLAVVAVVLLSLVPAPGAAIQVGIGLAGGESFPMAQSDTGRGGQYGLRLPVNLLPLLTVEPFLFSTDLGSVETTVGGRTYSRSGFDILSYGAIAALGGTGMGPRYPLYPFVGVGGFHPSREGSARVERTGYILGVGYARALPADLALNLRSDVNWMSVDGSARRFFEVSLGVSLRFHSGVEEGF